MLFRRIVLCALLVGALAGLLVTAVQHWQAIPLIAAAEVFEGSAEAADSFAATAHDHDHDPAHGDAHAHDAEEWAPSDGTERHAWTAIANVMTAIGFGLVLVAGITTWEHLRGRPLASARTGLVWGAAGWICVFGLPTLGLPPELPGSVAAPLADRQAWWLLTAASGGAGLALFAFVRGPLRLLASRCSRCPLPSAHRISPGVRSPATTSISPGRWKRSPAPSRWRRHSPPPCSGSPSVACRAGPSRAGCGPRWQLHDVRLIKARLLPPLQGEGWGGDELSRRRKNPSPS